jgi:hypothetical protein
MVWYRCLIRGENFPRWDLDDQDKPVGVRKYGFYTTRWVVASSPKEAEKNALALLRREKMFALPPGEPKPAEAKVFFEEIVRTGPTLRRGAGATWFPMDESDENSAGD